MANERSFTVPVVNVPQLQLTVGRSADQVFSVEELNVGNGLFVAAENVKCSLCVAEVVIVDTVVGRPEGQVVAAGGVELDATNVGLRLEGGHGMSHVCRPA